jgi:hypothetical protein
MTSSGGQRREDEHLRQAAVASGVLWRKCEKKKCKKQKEKIK